MVSSTTIWVAIRSDCVATRQQARLPPAITAFSPDRVLRTAQEACQVARSVFPVLDYFESLGDAVADAWRARNLDELAFPAIAERALEDHPPPEHVDVAALIRDALTCPASRLVSQENVDSAFGGVALTVYSGRRFHIVVNTWLDASTAIHEHSFSGAFRVWQGSSIHARCALAEREAVNSHLRLGELVIKELELLDLGDVRQIVPGGAGAHALFHLHSPSITIVIRTDGEQAFSPQMVYLPPGVAVDVSYFDRSADAVLRRRIQLLHMVLDADPDSFAATLEQAARVMDGASLFEVLRTLMPYLVDRRGGIAEALAELGEAFDILTAAQPALGRIAPAVLADIARVRAGLLRRRRLRVLEHRFLLGALLNAPDRAGVLKLIRLRFPGRDPEALLMTWMDDLLATPDGNDSSFNVLGLQPDSSKVLRMMILGATTAEQLLRELRAQIASDVVAASEDDVRRLQADFLSHGLCRSLFR
jgi:hypothetical protein